MGFRRYVATTAREALHRVRLELGAEAVILSNRRLDSGRIEIIAAAEGQMRNLVDEFEPVNVASAASATSASVAMRGKMPPVARKPAVNAAAKPEPARPGRAMPESFQEFIRRQTTIAQPRLGGAAMYDDVAHADEEPAPPALRPASPPAAAFRPVAVAAEPVAGAAPAVFRRRPSRAEPFLSQPAEPAPATPHPAASAPAVTPAAPSAALSATTAAPPPPAVEPAVAAAVPDLFGAAPSTTAGGMAAGTQTSSPTGDTRVMEELRSLRSVLADRISNLEVNLASKVAATRPLAATTAPGQLALARQVMIRLLMSGFSPELARRVAEKTPAGLEAAQADAWLQAVVARNVRCPVEDENPVSGTGAIALVGPTGVGKTTTIAKLAARHAVRHGASSLGLITLDSYRIGAHEQLRSYGRILGVPVFAAHDASSLKDVLASLRGKRTVLIDTCGMSQRDQRLTEMLGLLDEVRFADQPIQRVLLLNAASHAETLDEVSRAWRLGGMQGTVLTKIDEAARIGGALDCMMRYRAPLLGITNGQRVPEDWHAANPALLAHIALKPFGSSFSLDGEEAQAFAAGAAAQELAVRAS